MDNDGRKPNDHNQKSRNKNFKRRNRSGNSNRQTSTSSGERNLSELNNSMERNSLGASGGGKVPAKSDKENSKKSSRYDNAEDAITRLVDLTGINFSDPPDGYFFRPKFESGTEGRKVLLRANFFKMDIRGDQVYRYLVTFENAPNESNQGGDQVARRLTKRLNQRLLLAFVTTTGLELFNGIGERYGYDNDRLLITPKPLNGLPDEGQTFRFPFREFEDGDLKSIDITIKRNGAIPLAFDKSPDGNVEQNRAVLQLIDILAKSNSFKNDIVYDTKIFVAENIRRRIEMAIRNNSTPYQLALGHHQSTRLCQGGVMQNVDRASAVLYKGGPLIDTMVNLLGGAFILRPDYRFSDNEHAALRELTRLRIETNYRGYRSRHTIGSFTRSASSRTMFNDNGIEISVFDYFRRQYPRAHLRFPHLPCVVYGPGKYLPIELCTLLPDQRNQHKLREELLKIVGQHTIQHPDVRERQIVQNAVQISEQAVLGECNIQLIPELVTVESRVLDAPTLQYGRSFQFKPQNGDWDMRPNRNIRNDQQKSFIRPCNLERWAFFSLSRKIDLLICRAFVEHLRDTGRTLGVEIANPMNPFQLLQSYQLEEIFDTCSKNNVQLVVIIMPKTNDYYKIKSLGDRVHGIPTQMISDNHYDNRARSADRNPRAPRGQKLFDSAYLTNLLSKINTKIGGRNVILSEMTRNACPILNKKTMVVGIDVNHPSPGEHSPSVAAVVGSIDSEFTRYQTVIHLNQERKEMVRVDNMIEPILAAFQKEQRFYPEHIIVYRDGVGEGQFPEVFVDEINPLRQKLEQIGIKKLTYVIVSKRHSTRFFPIKPNDATKSNTRFFPNNLNDTNATKSGNILPGSVIDTEICHYKWFDFYICSHNALKGTARPGKYTVLWNSSPALADDLQKATYYLCYLFARATKSISDPAPARYAHHAAARGKIHLNELVRSLPQPINYEAANELLNNSINANDRLRNILYFT